MLHFSGNRPNSTYSSILSDKRAVHTRPFPVQQWRRSWQWNGWNDRVETETRVERGRWDKQWRRVDEIPQVDKLWLTDRRPVKVHSSHHRLATAAASRDDINFYPRWVYANLIMRRGDEVGGRRWRETQDAGLDWTRFDVENSAASCCVVMNEKRREFDQRPNDTTT